MRIFTPKPGVTERISFLDLHGPSSPRVTWQEAIASRNSDLDLPAPYYFRLPEGEREQDVSLATWDLRYEVDDRTPTWRPVYATPVAVWSTGDRGQLRQESGRPMGTFLHQVQVRLLVVDEDGLGSLVRAARGFPAAEHDYLITPFPMPSSGMDISVCRESLVIKIGNTKGTQAARAALITEVLAQELQGYRDLTSEEVAEIVAPLFWPEVFRARVRLADHERDLIEAELKSVPEVCIGAFLEGLV
jgi:hypothetical protein